MNLTEQEKINKIRRVMNRKPYNKHHDTLKPETIEKYQLNKDRK